MLQVLQYLARAYYKAGKMKEAKATLLKARRVAPQVGWRKLQYQIFYCVVSLLDTSLIRILGTGYFLAILSMLEQCFRNWFSNSIKCYRTQYLHTGGSLLTF
jgi:hypothetical protein